MCQKGALELKKKRITWKQINEQWRGKIKSYKKKYWGS